MSEDFQIDIRDYKTGEKFKMMELKTSEFNYGLAEFYAARSNREALLWSVLKWLNYSTIHGDGLLAAWHCTCGLCKRHAHGGTIQECRDCPLAKAGHLCVGWSGDESLWTKAEDAFNGWKLFSGRGEKYLEEFRTTAREFTKVLTRIYNHLYDQKIGISFKDKKIIGVKL